MKSTPEIGMRPKTRVSWSHSIRVAALVLLLSFIVTNTPWRLIALTGYVFTTPVSLVMMPADHSRYWDCLNLEYRLKNFGWAVTYLDINGVYGYDSYGLTSFHDRSIVIEQSLSWSARYEVLAHEGGHVFQPYALSQQQKEVFAETVAALVSKDAMREHARYLARTRGDYLLVVLTEWQQLYRVAALLTDI